MWNLGREPSTDDLTVTSASSPHHYSHNNNKSSNQKSLEASAAAAGSLRPSALHLPQAQPDISLLEAQPDPPAPFTIDTSHYNTSRVVINPGTPTEPTYELEKKGHTSVIRVSYPGPGDHIHHQPPPPQQQTVLKSFQPGGGVAASDRTSASQQQHHHHSSSHHQQQTSSSNRDVTSAPPKHRSRSPPSSSSLTASSGGPAATVPIVQRVPPPPIRQDSAMGLESFHFVAVLGRGHFGKVSEQFFFHSACIFNKKARFGKLICKVKQG